MAKNGKRIRKQVSDAFTFLFPRKVISEEHLSKQDVIKVKRNICKKLGPINLVIATGMLLFNVGMLLAMNLTTNGDQVGVYGLASLISQIIGVVGAFVTAIFIGLSFQVQNSKISVNMKRIGCDLLFLCIASQMILSIYSDAYKGFTTHATSLSAGILLMVVLMLAQPAFWLEALILDIGVVFCLIGTSAFCTYQYGMTALPYYIAVSVAFLICAYIIICLLFYAETQRYCQILQNERIHNVAIYDELTKCKNRNALKEYLEENKKRWESKSINLLLIMFDIDNFKEYNDQYSHLGGDYCLKTICESVHAEFPSPDLNFFRWGGEEFLLFFELEDPHDAKEYLERVHGAIHEAEIVAPKGAPKDIVTISIGAHLIKNVEFFEFNEQLAIVDKYLYRAKESGKDVICYDNRMLRHIHNHRHNKEMSIKA